MKLVVGLGNPGPRYRETRHNVGFLVADELARRAGVVFESAPAEAIVARLRQVPGGPAMAVKPLTMMNASGTAVAALARYYRVEPADLLVVADDVNLPLGRLRARAGGSAGGHNGFRSIEQELGTDQWPRLRIGVGRGDERRDLAAHVLAKFEPDERAVVADAIGRAADAVDTFLASGLEMMMNRFNADPVAGEKRTGQEAPREPEGPGDRNP